MNEGKIEKLKLLAIGDLQYRTMKQQFSKQEKHFLKTIHNLPGEQQDIIWEFVFASDALDRRLLEIACDYISF